LSKQIFIFFLKELVICRNCRVTEKGSMNNRESISNGSAGGRLSRRQLLISSWRSRDSSAGFTLD
jgi:hypothetical protein